MQQPGRYPYQSSRKDDFVHRTHRRERRIYVYLPRDARIRTVFLLVCAALFLFSAVKLLQYARDARKAINTSDQLQAIYYADATTAVTPVPTAFPTSAPEEAATQAPIISNPIVSAPNTRLGSITTPLPVLKTKSYPRNAQGASTNQQFVKLQQQNSDIIGWLSIPNIVDEAVVQRDNIYYLDRDSLGRPNTNGAIFLDEATDLATRPYTLPLYGHNMKSGLMFGRLRNYETLSYYKHNAFITFNTIHEDGLYVILGTCTISITPASDHFVDLIDLTSMDSLRRGTALLALMRQSPYNTPIDIRVDDQLLLLITCVEKDDERRVVYARRVRDNETQADLQLLVNQTTTYSP